MPGMSMQQETWYGGAAAYLGVWMGMMVPMMLPSLLPMLSGYRRSVRPARAVNVHGLAALAIVGYFAVWAIIGAAAYVVSAGIMSIEMRSGRVAALLPLAAGVGLLLAGSVQFTAWKRRQLALCRKEGCRGAPETNALTALRHGLTLGVRCSLCCGSLMLALLTIGMMNLVAMAVVMVVISAERLAPARLQIARVAGAAIVTAGVLTIMGLY
jgi:predicted metal-binding membrane protein